MNGVQAAMAASVLVGLLLVGCNDDDGTSRPDTVDGTSTSASATRVRTAVLPTASADTPRATTPIASVDAADANSPVAGDATRDAEPTAYVAPTATPAVIGPIVTPGGSQAATGLSATSGCDETNAGLPIADMAWSPSATGGDQQRVVVTIFVDGFETNRYEAGPPLSASASSFRWEGNLSVGLQHRWRVLTLHNGTWTPSEDGIFDGPRCIADQAG